MLANNESIGAASNTHKDDIHAHSNRPVTGTVKMRKQGRAHTRTGGGRKVREKEASRLKTAQLREGNKRCSHRYRSRGGV